LSNVRLCIRFLRWGRAIRDAYWRGDALEKRREMMQAWADYLSSDAGSKVIPIASAMRKA
jgi:hypothetical protein